MIARPQERSRHGREGDPPLAAFLAGSVLCQSGHALWDTLIIRKRKRPREDSRGALDSRRCSRGYAAGTRETHRAALVPGLMQRQSDPQSLFAVHFTSGHPTVEAQPDRRPPGLTQVQPDPQLPDAQSPAPEQVPSARQRLVPPPISRQTQPDPQGLVREHSRAGQVGGSSVGAGASDRTHTPL
jgi:hypothetical protein